MSYQGRRALGVRCHDCNVRLNSTNRGKLSPYWCAPCDESRVKRIDASMKEIARGFGVDVEKP